MATKKLVPRANDEGGIGTAAKTWGDSWLKNLTLTGLATGTSSSFLIENSGLIEKRTLSSLTLTVADTENTTCYVGLWEAATGSLQPKTDEGLTYNALTGSEVLSLIGDFHIGGVDAVTSNIQKQSNAINLPGGIFNINGADAVGVYSGAGTATGGPIFYNAGSGTGTGPPGYHVWTLPYIFASGNAGVSQVKTTAMFLSTDNDENSILSMIDLDGLINYQVRVGQGAVRLYTTTSGIPIEIGCDTLDGSLIKFQDHTSTTYGDTLATVQSLRIESFLIACSDETSSLTAGNAKATFRIPYAFTLTDVRASVNTAPTGAILTVDINDDATTMLSTKLTIAIGAKTSVGGVAHAFALSPQLIVDDSEITIDIDVIGSTVAGKGLKVILIGHKTV